MANKIKHIISIILLFIQYNLYCQLIIDENSPISFFSPNIHGNFKIDDTLSVFKNFFSVSDNLGNFNSKNLIINNKFISPNKYSLGIASFFENNYNYYISINNEDNLDTTISIGKKKLNEKVSLEINKDYLYLKSIKNNFNSIFYRQRYDTLNIKINYYDTYNKSFSMFFYKNYIYFKELNKYPYLGYDENENVFLGINNISSPFKSIIIGTNNTFQNNLYSNCLIGIDNFFYSNDSKNYFNGINNYIEYNNKNNNLIGSDNIFIGNSLYNFLLGVSNRFRYNKDNNYLIGNNNIEFSYNKDNNYLLGNNNDFYNNISYNLLIGNNNVFNNNNENFNTVIGNYNQYTYNFSKNLLLGNNNSIQYSNNSIILANDLNYSNLNNTFLVYINNKKVIESTVYDYTYNVDNYFYGTTITIGEKKNIKLVNVVKYNISYLDNFILSLAEKCYLPDISGYIENGRKFNIKNISNNNLEIRGYNGQLIDNQNLYILQQNKSVLIIAFNGNWYTYNN